MNWMKAIDELPKENEEVLIRVNGIFMLGTYNQKSKTFADKLGAGCFAPISQISWARIEGPGEEPASLHS